MVIVIECKANARYHESKKRDKYDKYAVDGVINYASHLSREFNVIALAISGSDKKNIKISNFLWLKEYAGYEELNSNTLLRVEDYFNCINNNEKNKKIQISELIKFSKELHNDMRDYAKLSESEKPLLVSGILIALKDPAFMSSYTKETSGRDLANSIISSIKKVLEHSNIEEAKRQNMIQPYSFIQVHPILVKDDVLMTLVNKIEKHVKPFINDKHNIDVLGQFYGEFLKYSAGDKKGLGIVLTPRHITELFVKMAKLTNKSKILDPCCGSASFLISAMVDMIEKCKKDQDSIDCVKKHCLFGVEQQPNMFALASSNMILRGDGKSNLKLGSCFSFFDELKKIGCNVGFINPPYSQKGEGLSELDFVKNLLNVLQSNSICIAIVPMSCGIGNSPIKQQVLDKHTLVAAMSMPDELFYPVGVITQILVFKTGIPHDSNVDTWFGYWKDDGFIKTKNEGRIDKNHKWNEIMSRWLDMYFNNKEIPGYSVKHKVTASDEWCAEAYMETDYTDITETDFIKEMKKYILFKMMNEDKLQSSMRNLSESGDDVIENF